MTATGVTCSGGKIGLIMVVPSSFLSLGIGGLVLLMRQYSFVVVAASVVDLCGVVGVGGFIKLRQPRLVMEWWQQRLVN